MNDFDDIIRQAPSAPAKRKVKAPLWVRVWFCILSGGVALSLLLAISTSVRATNNTATINADHDVIQELTRNVLSLHNDTEADRDSVAELRRDTGLLRRDAFALIDGNADRLVRLQVFTEQSVEGLNSIAETHTEAMDSLRRMNVRQDQSVTDVRDNQKLVGKAITELTAAQASMFEALKRVAASKQ